VNRFIVWTIDQLWLLLMYTAVNSFNWKQVYVQATPSFILFMIELIIDIRHKIFEVQLNHFPLTKTCVSSIALCRLC